MIGLTDSPVIETNYGRVKGRTFHFGQHSASSFLGIPYAKPPTGELRFKVTDRVLFVQHLRSFAETSTARGMVSNSKLQQLWWMLPFC
jgi:carboxylesterase type B